MLISLELVRVSATQDFLILPAVHLLSTANSALMIVRHVLALHKVIVPVEMTHLHLSPLLLLLELALEILVL